MWFPQNGSQQGPRGDLETKVLGLHLLHVRDKGVTRLGVGVSPGSHRIRGNLSLYTVVLAGQHMVWWLGSVWTPHISHGGPKSHLPCFLTCVKNILCPPFPFSFTLPSGSPDPRSVRLAQEGVPL